jgi:hypothetical protein
MCPRLEKIDKRKRGIRNPPNLTRLEIIMCLLDGEKSRREIRDYLKQELKINDPSGIDKHLNELIDKGFIIKNEKEHHDGKGIPPVYFRLVDDWYSFKKFIGLYRYIIALGYDTNDRIGRKKDWDLEFLKSKYAKQMINEIIIIL